MKIRQFCW
jgi:hypothetical protein